MRTKKQGKSGKRSAKQSSKRQPKWHRSFEGEVVGLTTADFKELFDGMVKASDETLAAIHKIYDQHGSVRLHVRQLVERVNENMGDHAKITSEDVLRLLSHKKFIDAFLNKEGWLKLAGKEGCWQDGKVVSPNNP